MAAFVWQQIGEESRVETRYGTAIIVERQGQYYWRIEQPSLGVTMRSEEGGSSPPYTDSFEQAEEYVLLNLAFLTEPPTVDPTNPHCWPADYQADYRGQKLTLELGEQALSQDTDPTHLVRLRVIRAILFRDASLTDAEDATIEPSAGTIQLDWIQDGDAWRIETRFGQAVITEYHKAPNTWVFGGRDYLYTAQIVHPSGATLPDDKPQEFSGYEDAEEYLRASLYDLEHPFADTSDRGQLIAAAEAQFPCHAFTLDVCARALGPDADPIHLERIKHIKSDFFLKVD